MVFIGGFQVQQVCEVVVNKAPTDHSWKIKSQPRTPFIRLPVICHGKIDSELLTILRSLVMTGSQTKTALSLSKSQSTISRTLSRARTLFHDPLFVHNGSMLVPTNRMLEIYGHLPKLLGEMEALLLKRYSILNPSTCTFVSQPLITRRNTSFFPPSTQ